MKFIYVKNRDKTLGKKTIMIVTSRHINNKLKKQSFPTTISLLNVYKSWIGNLIFSRSVFILFSFSVYLLDDEVIAEHSME